MCSPIQSMMENKTVSKITDYTGAGLLYKNISGGQKLSESVKSGNIYAGYAGGALLNQMNKRQAKKEQSII